MDEIILAIMQGILVFSLGVKLKSDDPYLLESADVLYRKIMAMPFILRTAMVILIYVFNFLGLISAICLFKDQNVDKRLRQIQQWKKSPIRLCREFIVFFEKMTVFIYYSICPDKN